MSPALAAAGLRKGTTRTSRWVSTTDLHFRIVVSCPQPASPPAHDSLDINLWRKHDSSLYKTVEMADLPSATCPRPRSRGPPGSELEVAAIKLSCRRTAEPVAQIRSNRR